MTTDWAGERQARINHASNSGICAANADMVERVVKGAGPNSTTSDQKLGARAIANIPAVHVPAFCHTRYMNTYDLATQARRLGKEPPLPSRLREMVDGVLKKLTDIPESDIYFLAVEINGTGIRFYGDVCLVLTKDSVDPETFVLTCNSYDLARPPMTPIGSDPDPGRMITKAFGIQGRWNADLADICVLKVFDLRPGAERRLTTGQISEAILQDEDYLEVLYQRPPGQDAQAVAGQVGAFDTGALQEARVSVADAALETRVGEQLRAGPCPSLAELQWRKHRKAALRALATKGVATRVVTTAGRVRT